MDSRTQPVDTSPAAPAVNGPPAHQADPPASARAVVALIEEALLGGLRRYTRA